MTVEQYEKAFGEKFDPEKFQPDYKPDDTKDDPNNDNDDRSNKKVDEWYTGFTCAFSGILLA